MGSFSSNSVRGFHPDANIARTKYRAEVRERTIPPKRYRRVVQAVIGVFSTNSDTNAMKSRIGAYANKSVPETFAYL